MRFLLFLSDFIVPLLVFYIVGFGILMKKNIYEDFVRGAAQGFHYRQSETDIRHEHSVHHVQVEPFGPAAVHAVGGSAEVQEVSGKK